MEILIAIGGGLGNVFFSVAAAKGGALGATVGVFALLPLYLVALSYGVRAAMIAGVTSFSVIVVFGGIGGAALHAVIVIAPYWLLTGLVLTARRVQRTGEAVRLEWISVGSIVTIVAVCCGAVFAVVALYHLGQPGGLEGIITRGLETALATMNPAMSKFDSADIVAIVAPLIPGGMLGTWLVISVVNVVFAQGLVARSNRCIRPTPAYTAMELPEWAPVPLIAAAVVALAGTAAEMRQMEYLGRNLLIVLAVPFFFQGLAVIHTLVRRLPAPGLALGLVYTSLLLMFSWIGLAVTGLGFVEQWARLRTRYVAPPNGQEEE